MLTHSQAIFNTLFRLGKWVIIPLVCPTKVGVLWMRKPAWSAWVGASIQALLAVLCGAFPMILMAMLLRKKPMYCPTARMVYRQVLALSWQACPKLKV